MGTSSALSNNDLIKQQKRDHFIMLLKNGSEFKLEKKHFDQIHKYTNNYNFNETWQIFFNTLTDYNKLTWLDMNNNSLGDIYEESNVRINLLYKYLITNSTLLWLDLSNNNIDDNCIKLIAGSLINNKCLSVLVLTNNLITANGAYLLSEGMKYNTTLNKLYLGKNKVSDEGIEYISSMLQSNTSITHLNVSKNKIKYNGIKALSSVLSYCSILWLEISENRMSIDELLLISEAANSSNANVKIMIKSKIDQNELTTFFSDTQYMHVYYFNHQGFEIGYKKRFTTAPTLEKKIDREYIV